MSPSNLSRVIVGICNRPRGRHMLWIKCQWLSNKSLSQGSDHPSKAASLTTDQHRKKKAAGTTAEIPISMAGKGRGRKGSLSFNSINKHFWVCFLLYLHEHLCPKPWWASGGISQIQTSQFWYSCQRKILWGSCGLCSYRAAPTVLKTVMCFLDVFVVPYKPLRRHL